MATKTLWQRVKGLFDSGGTAETSAGGLLASVVQSGNAPRRGTRELLQAYRTHPWLHSVVHRIASEVSQQHFLLFRSQSTRRMDQKAARLLQTRNAINYAPADAVPLEDHPLLQLLENPNPTFTRAMFFHLVQAYLETKGECPIVIERGAGGQAKELWPVPPTWLVEVPHLNFPFYRFSFGSWQRTIPEDDVIYMRHPELEQPYLRGVGFGESLADELDIDEFATKHLKSWFFNRALPDVFLSVEGVESEEEAKRYEEVLRQKHGGRNKAFQVHVTNGKVDLKQVGHTFREQMLPEIRTQSRDVVLQVYGMPPEIMGIVENSNRATIDAAQVIFTKFLIAPRVSFSADAFTHWARREYNDPTLVLGFSNPIPEDHTFTLSVMVAQPGLFTKNEWRGLAGRTPVDGWDNEYAEAARLAISEKLTDPNAVAGAVDATAAAAAASEEAAKKPADGEDPEDVPTTDSTKSAADRGLLRLVRAAVAVAD